MCNITFKEKTVEWEYEGLTIKAIIHFWSKDYHAEMIEPYSVYFGGGHLMYMTPMVYVAVDDNEQDEASKYHTKNIVPIVKEDCELWLRNKEFNTSTQRFAIGFSTEAIEHMNIVDLIEKILPIRAEKKSKKALMKSGDISQKDYQIYLNYIRETLYSVDKEITLRSENYVTKHYSHVFSNNPSYNVEDPRFWSSNSCCSNDGLVSGELIAKNMIINALKQQYEKATNAVSN